MALARASPLPGGSGRRTSRPLTFFAKYVSLTRCAGSFARSAVGIGTIGEGRAIENGDELPRSGHAIMDERRAPAVFLGRGDVSDFESGQPVLTMSR